MSSTGCDPLFGCLPLKHGVRACAVAKGVVSLLSCGLPIALMALPFTFWQAGLRPDVWHSCLFVSFCYNFVIIEVLNAILSVALFCLAGKPPVNSLYIPCSIMNVLNVFYIIWIIVASNYAENSTTWFVGNFLPSGLLTIYTTLVVWWKVRQEKKATQKVEAVNGDTQGAIQSNPSSGTADNANSSGLTDQVEPYGFTPAQPQTQPGGNE